MKLLKTLFVALAVTAAGTAFAVSGEFKNECATGLSLGKHIKTDCSINSQVDGKTYCFGNEDAKAMFSKDPKATIMKAEEFAKSGK